ncbi:hypothetical protein GCM10009117_25540 [Gangjinia marincola]|uniref:Uncharacterized protein n=1 Tax=Gangjinia marincola TaxID=578463 RepID=A0ABN1MKG5_9FLAO
MKDTYNFKVNWIDGMKINKGHFVETENALIQFAQTAGARDINVLNYGLLAQADASDAVEMILSMDGQDTVNVTLNKCRAITPGGYIIDITPDIASHLNQLGSVLESNYKRKEEDDECYIILGVNPYERVPFGEADPQEEPPRHPHVLPGYQLHIVSKAEINNEEFGKYHLTIGKILFEENGVQLAADFIPPCCSIQSHQDLKYTFAEIHTFFNAMEKYSMGIIQKIHQKKQANDLARMVMTISENTLQHLGGMIPAFRTHDRHQPPVVMVTRLMSLARVIKNSIDVYVGTGKEELLNYLSDWCDLNQGAFENVMVEMIEVDYQHTDINKTLYHISDFTKLMLSLFKKLHELDYIGKKSDSNIFVKEEILAKQDVKNRRSFLLD